MHFVKLLLHKLEVVLAFSLLRLASLVDPPDFDLRGVTPNQRSLKLRCGFFGLLVDKEFALLQVKSVG